MATKYLFRMCSIAGIGIPALMFIAKPVEAKETQVGNRSKQLEIVNKLLSEKKKDSQRILTDAQKFSPVLSQADSGENVKVTGIKVNSTEQGLELILETSQGRQLQITNNSDSNSFIADIKNAQLVLNNGDQFTQEKPVAGISEITVINKDANTIRITVTGEKGIPKAELFDSNQGLIFGFTPIASSTEPSTTSPGSSQQEQASEEQTQSTDEKRPEETPQSAEQNEDIIELIVTAQKRAENLQDVPISITALDRDQIESVMLTLLMTLLKIRLTFHVFGSGANSSSKFL
ncbi:MAG: AMIN domain-containing protein [Richelia sp. SM1_7_0]|nr:AMIN domain-containing protein [Richelia sp. SM1_7_0]